MSLGRSPLHHPGDRWTDRPVLQKIWGFGSWVGRNADIIGRLWMLAISIVLTITAIRVNDLKDDADRTRESAARSAKIASDQAHASCERTKLFGPELAVAYKKYGILSSQSLAAYKAGIPTTCPR